MSDSASDQKLFKLILNAIASDSLQPSDYKLALNSLKNGEMVAIIEQILGALAGPQRVDRDERIPRRSSEAKPKEKLSRSASKGRLVKTADQIFDDVKRRKVNRDRLVAILSSLDADTLRSLDTSDTMRNIIRQFEASASSRQWQLLDSIVNGAYESDPYLDTISNAP